MNYFIHLRDKRLNVPTVYRDGIIFSKENFKTDLQSLATLHDIYKQSSRILFSCIIYIATAKHLDHRTKIKLRLKECIH